jgi:hypothetical protein
MSALLVDATGYLLRDNDVPGAHGIKGICSRMPKAQGRLCRLDSPAKPVRASRFFKLHVTLARRMTLPGLTPRANFTLPIQAGHAGTLVVPPLLTRIRNQIQRNINDVMSTAASTVLQALRAGDVIPNVVPESATAGVTSALRVHYPEYTISEGEAIPRAATLKQPDLEFQNAVSSQWAKCESCRTGCPHAFALPSYTMLMSRSIGIERDVHDHHGGPRLDAQKRQGKLFAIVHSHSSRLG